MRGEFVFDFVFVSHRLGDLLDSNNGGIWGEDPDGGSNDHPVLRSTDQALDGSWQIADPAVRKLTPSEFERTYLVTGDLLVTKSSGSPDHIGKTSVVTPDIEKIGYGFSNFMQRLRLNKNVEPKFVAHLLNSEIGRAQFRLLSTTTTGLGNLSAKIINEVVVPLPNLTEQRAIADYLDRETAKLDALIAAKEHLLDLLAEKRRALITHAVTRGLDTDAPMRDSGVEWLGEIPAHWEMIRVKHFAQVGNGSTPLRDNEAYWQDGTFPWLTSTVVNDDVISEPTDFVTEIALDERHLPIVQPDSVLVAVTGEGKTRGKAALLRYHATINQHLAFISPRRNWVNSEFLQLFLSGSYEILRMISESTGSTKGALTCEQLGEFPVLLPPITEQLQIISSVISIKASLDLLTQATIRTIKLLLERRAALIAAAVSGKLKIPQT